jgi:hypothetical protein
MKMERVKIFSDFYGRTDDLEIAINRWLEKHDSAISNVKIEYKFHNQYVFCFIEYEVNENEK